MVFLHLLEPQGIDFPLFYEASWMWLHGLNPYLHLLTKPSPFNYPPSAILFLFWPGLFSFRLSAAIWNLTSLFSFLSSLYLLGFMTFKKAWNLSLFLTLTLMFTVLFFPEKYTLSSGQINNFVLLFCVLSLWWYQKHAFWKSALILGLACAIKLTPLVFLFPFILHRDFKQVFRLLLVFGLFFLVPFIIMPIPALSLYFTKIFFTPLTFTEKNWYYNQSILAFFSRSLPLYLIKPAYYLSLILLPLISWWRLRSRSLPTLYALAACLYLLLHPLAWQHHFVFAVIPFFTLIPHLPIKLLYFPYALLAANIRQFESLPSWAAWLLSHQFYGTFLLWIYLFSYRPCQKPLKG